MLLFVLVYADFDLRDVSYLDYLFVSLDYMLDFLKFAGIRMYPRACGYPRVAGTGIILYPWRVAGAGADLSSLYPRGFYPLPSIPSTYRLVL